MAAVNAQPSDLWNLEGPLFVVEDNWADFDTISTLLGAAGSKAKLVHCETGEQLWEKLGELIDGQPVLALRRLPLHILLDLNLPGSSGMEILLELRSHSIFKTVPVTILTTSPRPEDVEGCYQAGASGYLIKPVNYDRFSEIIRNFVKYWLGSVKLPSYRLASARLSK